MLLLFCFTQPTHSDFCCKICHRYHLSLIGTDGTAIAEITLFGRVARHIISKHVLLLWSSSKNQHGSSGAEFEHMLLDLAALVSQIFTFYVSISQRNLTRRNVCFQVNSILTFFGNQTHIPNSNELSFDQTTETSAIVYSTSSHHDSCWGTKIGKSPPTQESRKKVRNSRKTGRRRISESLYSPQKL